MIRFTGGSIVQAARGPACGMKSNIRESIRIAASGACAACAKMLITWPAVMRVRVGEVEGPAVEPVDVGDVVHRPGDEVDRDDVDLPPLDADRRGPTAGTALRSALDQLEEVVGAVDLVHLAGLGVADDDAGPVDAPRHLALLAHDGLGLVLGLEVGVVVDLLGLLEHVLA